MPKKAEYDGTCQCCGAIQKLPGGLLAQHGYQVVWQSFRGVCPGSRHLPLEVSCDLLARFAEEAEQAAADFLVQAKAALEADVSGGVGWKYEWIKGQHVGSRWVPGHYEWRPNVKYSGPDASQAAYCGNVRYANYLRSKAGAATTRANQLHERLENWEPGNLIPAGRKSS